MDFLKNYDIVLASNSPRRKELLAGLDISYRVSVLPDIDESYPETLQGEEIPLYIAKKKAEAYKKLLTDRTLLITADTIVWLDGRVYGKPLDKTDARAMLHALSEKTHTVITGVSITTSDKEVSFATSTEVSFASLTEEEIDYYVEKYSPLDKAGAYGIQEWIGVCRGYRHTWLVLQCHGAAHTKALSGIEKILTERFPPTIQNISRQRPDNEYRAESDSESDNRSLFFAGRYEGDFQIAGEDDRP